MGRSSTPLSKRARSSRMQERRLKQSETPNKPSSCQGLFNDSPLKQDHPPLRNKSAPSLTTVSDDLFLHLQKPLHLKILFLFPLRNEAHLSRPSMRAPSEDESKESAS